MCQEDPIRVRIAYISTQGQSVVQERARAIESEFLKRWPPGSNIPKLEFSIYKFELSPDSMNPLPESDALNRVMMESVMMGKPKIIYAAGADSVMLAKKYTKDIPIIFGCT